jgi:putative transcriptional regulator
MLLVAIARRAYYTFLLAAFVALYFQAPSEARTACHTSASGIAPGSLRGQMLVATPRIDDGYFQHTRVYLLAHDGQGALGVVLNKDELAAGVWDGGPVGRDRVITLVDEHATREGSLKVADGVSIMTDPDLLDDEHVRSHARVFVGYAGWAPGQLERELKMGAWRVVQGSAHEALDAPSLASRAARARDPFDDEEPRDPFMDP